MTDALIHALADTRRKLRDVDGQLCLPGSKRCPKCKTVKAYGDFSRRSKTKDGRASVCRDCQAKADRKRARKKSYRKRNNRDLRAFQARHGKRARCPVKAAARKAVQAAIRKFVKRRKGDPSAKPCAAWGELRPVREGFCFDCGADGSKVKLRYDHFKGYEPENHLAVELVCSPCDGLRSRARGERAWAGVDKEAGQRGAVLGG